MMEARTSKVFKTILGFFNSRVCYHFFFFGLLIVSLGRNTTVSSPGSKDHLRTSEDLLCEGPEEPRDNTDFLETKQTIFLLPWARSFLPLSLAAL